MRACICTEEEFNFFISGVHKCEIQVRIQFIYKLR